MHTQEQIKEMNKKSQAISNAFDACHSWAKENRFKLATCYNGEVMSKTVYRKYIGQGYLKVTFEQPSQSYKLQIENSVTFEWSSPTKVLGGHKSFTYPLDTDFGSAFELQNLKNSLVWYKELQDKIKASK